jgi:hypothetical protein
MKLAAGGWSADGFSQHLPGVHRFRLARGDAGIVALRERDEQLGSDRRPV